MRVGTQDFIHRYLSADNHRGLSLLLLHGAGEYDPLIRIAEAERLADTLKGFGAQVMFQRQRADHRLIEADILAAHDWIQQTNTFSVSSTG